MIDWGKVPWPLWVFAALNVAGAVLIEVEASGSILTKVLFVGFLGAWLFFLLRGVRWVWIGTLVVILLGFLADLVSRSLVWHDIVLGLFGPVLLLLPVTRRYFARMDSLPGRFE